MCLAEMAKFLYLLPRLCGAITGSHLCLAFFSFLSQSAHILVRLHAQAVKRDKVKERSALLESHLHVNDMSTPPHQSAWSGNAVWQQWFNSGQGQLLQITQ